MDAEAWSLEDAEAFQGSPVDDGRIPTHDTVGARGPIERNCRRLPCLHRGPRESHAIHQDWTLLVRLRVRGHANDIARLRRAERGCDGRVLVGWNAERCSVLAARRCGEKLFVGCRNAWIFRGRLRLTARAARDESEDHS